ncbi:cytochrome c3 family protein [Rhodoferax ferrireducens]|uniref:cytochrome c3 family protein n=1 Tax=Rhodoferax ferrireducens TaxID=192843 RepID=UPI003BB71865
MKRGWLMALIAANLLVLVVLIFTYPHLMVSPGPVVAAHAEIATDCFACHAPWRGASAARCVSCHVLPDIGLRTSKGVAIVQRTRKTSFHQALVEQDCMACHSDHAAPKLTRRSRKPFSHLLLKTAVREQCQSCHQAPTDKLHGQITGNCNQCHSQQAWKPATFEHDKLFLLDRDHAASCETCHSNNDYRRYTCYGCHEHSLDKIRSEHQEEGIGNFENCVECHRSAQEEPENKGSGKRKRKDKEDDD